jgi:hypothetical protein
MEDIVVSSWAELNERLYENSWNERLGRFRSNYAFRGMPDVNYDLKTSLQVMGGEYERHEDDLLRNFRKYAYRNAVSGDSVWNWLALAKHHGLPTRLLDWTYSPYVALHFATQDLEQFGVDAVIWCVDYVRTNQQLPDKLKAELLKEDSIVFTAEMLKEVASTLQELDGLSHDPFMVFFEPPSLDDRIVNQYALFSLVSSPTARTDEWLSRNPDLFHRLIVPASLKWEVRDKLDQANITERVLFPGLDGLSRWLRRYYSPRMQ